METRASRSYNKKKIKKAKLRKGETLASLGLVLAPGVVGLPNVVHASEFTNEDQATNPQQEQRSYEINSLSIPEEIREADKGVEGAINIQLNSPDIKTLTVKLSPNIQILNDRSYVTSETGEQIGSYEINHNLNEMTITINNTRFTQVNAKFMLTLKEYNFGQQTIIASSQDSVQIAHVTAVQDLTKFDNENALSNDEDNKETEDTEMKEDLNNAIEDGVDNSTTDTETEVVENEKEDSKEDSKEEESEEATEEQNVDVPYTVPSQNEYSVPLQQTIESLPLTGGPWQTPQQKFISDVAPHASRVAKANGLYASVMIAQAILESGYGESTLSAAPNHNLFGIKGSYQGQSVRMLTWEHYNGKNVQIYDNFRKYPSFTESFEDNARVLRTTSFTPGVYFYSGTWVENTSSYQDATKALTGRYATDPYYNIKLNNLIQTHNLTQYDNGGGGTINTNTGGGSTTTNPSTPSTPSTNGYYTVKSGDTLFRIAQNHNMSVATLKSVNGLSSDLIYPGQKLKVTTGTTSGGGSSVQGNTNTSTPSSPSTPSTQTTTHTVRSGDTLYGIAVKYGTSVSAIQQLNGMTTTVIYPNQVLKVRGTQETPKPSAPVTTPTKTESSTQTHTVKPRETLYGISIKYKTTVDELKQLNGLNGNTIYVGQTLKVGKGASNQEINNATIKEDTTTHTVRSGENLFRIGLRYNMSVYELKQLNGLTSDFIYVGQTLNVAKPNTKVSVPTSSLSKYHTVKNGETLYRIARNNGTRVENLKHLNGLTSDIIYVGQSLRVG